MKKITFLGNCQTRRLYVLYNEQFVPITGDSTELVANFEEPTPRVRKILAEADVIVAQVTDAEQKVSVNKIETSAQIIEFPYVTGNFLWPFSGREHIHNQPLPHFHDGPYGVQYGNPWLNSRIKSGANPDDIAAEYESLNISKAVNLDRTYELSMDRARQRDARTGFSIAATIEKYLTDIPLFMSPANLELALFRPLAAGVFERLGVPSTTVNAMLDTLWRTPFPIADHPIHPSVAEHFGLKFIGPNTRYRTFTGERLTFKEWVGRYVRYEWNDLLLAAVLDAGTIRSFGDPAQQALDRIEAGLAGSSGSSFAETRRAHLLKLKGDDAGALAATRRATALEPDNPQTIGTLAFYLADQGECDEAERQARHLTQNWPHYADGWNRLGSILIRRGKTEEAIDAVARAIEIDPRNFDICKHYGSLLAHAGYFERARDALARGITVMPRQPALYVELSKLSARVNDLDSALMAIRRALDLDPGNIDAHTHHVDILSRRNDLVGVHVALREGLKHAPGHRALSNLLINALVSLGRHDEANTEYRRALAADPSNFSLRHMLAENLMKQGAYVEAEATFAEGISAFPLDERLHTGLASALARQGRFAEAEASARRAIQLKPDHSLSHHILANTLLSSGKLSVAERAFRAAIAHDPNNADLRGDLALAVSRQGRIAEGLAIMDEAIATAPRNPHLLAKQACLLMEKGNLARARTIAESAVALAPNLAGLKAIIGDISEREGDRPAALLAYQAAIDLDPGNSHYRRQAERLGILDRIASDAAAAE
jgi:tetratricopeptide (TPR) repeat protein